MVEDPAEHAILPRQYPAISLIEKEKEDNAFHR